MNDQRWNYLKPWVRRFPRSAQFISLFIGFPLLVIACALDGAWEAWKLTRYEFGEVSEYIKWKKSNK